MLAEYGSGGAAIGTTHYDRTKCDVGIVHLGYGAFHRAHQAVYIDDYMERSGDLRWGIAAVNLREAESMAFKAAQTVDNGYLLKTISTSGEQDYRFVRSHCRFVDWSQEIDEAEALLTLASVHTVTITVTESGYYLKHDWSLDSEHPVIAAEISQKEFKSVYAYLANALRKRAQTLNMPINILCCDNMRSNGRMLKRNFLSYLKYIGDNDLYVWVEENASFPCSMVDRITPRATDELRQEVATLFPGEYVNPIHGESYKQWVIEDKFKAPMPDLMQSGVEFVSDVDPYEEAKIRILNGGHTALCYLGVLAGHQTFDQAFKDPRLRSVFDALQIEEVLPGLNIDLPFDKHNYLALISDRFSNTAIADQLERICMDGYSKMPIFIRPTIKSCLKQDIIPRKMFYCVASWYVYARRIENGKLASKYHEAYWSLLKPLVAEGQEEAFVRSKDLWADLPDKFPQFVNELLSAIREVELQWLA